MHVVKTWNADGWSKLQHWWLCGKPRVAAERQLGFGRARDGGTDANSEPILEPIAEESEQSGIGVDCSHIN